VSLQIHCSELYVLLPEEAEILVQVQIRIEQQNLEEKKTLVLNLSASHSPELVVYLKQFFQEQLHIHRRGQRCKLMGSSCLFF